MNHIEAMKQALDALTCTGESDDLGHRCGHCDDYVDRNGLVRSALRAAIEQAESVPHTGKYTQPRAWWRLSADPECLPCATTDPEEAQQWRTDGHDVRELVEQAEGQRCNPHPDAPHGFNRNASHTEGRYVCDCEGWSPDCGQAEGQESCFCDLAYPDSNPDASCGDCPIRDYHPAPAQPPGLDITIDDDEALAYLRDMIVQADGDLTPIRLVVGDWQSGQGLYVASADYPDEGAVKIADVATTPPAAQPAQEPEGSVCACCGGIVFDQVIEPESAQPALKPLTPHEIGEVAGTHEYGPEELKWFRLGEAAHGIKEQA
jgi:hypothetical protein